MQQPRRYWDTSRRPAEVYYEVRRRNRKVPADAIVLGATAPGEKVYLDDSARLTHFLALGPTEVGKTKVLELIARAIILRRQEALIVLDPNRDLADDIKAFCHATGQTDRLLILDPAMQRNAILGFNPMATGGTDIETEAWRDVQVFLRVLGGQDPLSTPRLLRWLYNLCVAIRSACVTYAEALELLRAQATTAGRGITRLVVQPDVRSEWDYVNDGAGAARRTEQLESTYSRIRAFLNNPVIRRMVGQTGNVLDPADIIDNKRILVVYLQQGHGLTDEDTRFLGTMLFSAFLREAISRPRPERQPLTIMADEAAKFVSNEIIEITTTGRKYRCSLAMGLQTTQQLVRTGGGVIDTAVLDAVNSCVRTAIVFGDLMPYQYRDFAQKLAVRSWNPRVVKEELYSLRQIVTGHERVTVHGYGSNHSTVAGAGDAVPFLETPFGGEQLANGGTHSDSESSTDSSSESEHETFLPILDTFKELTKREYVSYQEHELGVLQQLVSQQNRHACLIRKGGTAQFFRVSDVEPVSITDADVAAGDRRIFENPRNPYALPATIEAQLEDRIERLELIELEAVALKRKNTATDPDASARTQRRAAAHASGRPKAIVPVPHTPQSKRKEVNHA